MNIYFKLFKVFFKIGAFTFGGGYAMIPLIEEEIVNQNSWIQKEDMFNIFAVAQSIPGAIAINTSTLVGYKIAGKRGAICSTFGVILPSFIIISLIATFFSQISESPSVLAVFTGINAAVIILIAMAAFKMLKIAIHDALSVLLVIATVMMILFTEVSPIFIILFGGFLGYFLYWYHEHFRGEK